MSDDISALLQNFPPNLPFDVARTQAGNGLPSEALLDWEQYSSNWYKNTVVTLDTRITDVKSQTDDNVAEIQLETYARTTADTAIAASISSLSTTVAGNTASLETIAESINGVAVKYGVTGYINGTTGGFVFTGVEQNNGSVSYNMEFTSNVTINGNLVVTGTINTNAIAAQAINIPYSASASGTNSTAADNTWKDMVTLGVSGGSGYYAFIGYVASLAGTPPSGSNLSYPRIRVIADGGGVLVPEVYVNIGVCDSSGNPNAGGYLANGGCAILLGLTGGDTIRLQIKNIPNTGSGIVAWWDGGTRLVAEVRKR